MLIYATQDQSTNEAVDLKKILNGNSRQESGHFPLAPPDDRHLLRGLRTTNSSIPANFGLHPALRLKLNENGLGDMLRGGAKDRPAKGKYQDKSLNSTEYLGTTPLYTLAP
jgi:hypothetical protein